MFAVKEPRISIRSLWRELAQEGLEVTYGGFVKWAASLGINERQFGVTTLEAEALKSYAKLRAATYGTRTAYKGYEKSQVISQLLSHGSEIYGCDAARIAEVNGACDKSTLYRRAQKRGLKFSSREKYKVGEIIKLITGEQS